MNSENKIVKLAKTIWSIEANRRLFKDVVLFFIASLVFNYLYWWTNMNHWLFGPFTADVFSWFKNLAFQGTKFLCSVLPCLSFESIDTTLFFYDTANNGEKILSHVIEIAEDCSGIKQLAQWALIMILCRGNWKGKSIYFFVGCVLILLANITRIYLLALIPGQNFALWELCHMWIARPLMYIVIFFMWAFWIKHFANHKKTNK